MHYIINAIKAIFILKNLEIKTFIFVNFEYEM